MGRRLTKLASWLVAIAALIAFALWRSDRVDPFRDERSAPASLTLTLAAPAIPGGVETTLQLGPAEAARLVRMIRSGSVWRADKCVHLGRASLTFESGRTVELSLETCCISSADPSVRRFSVRCGDAAVAQFLADARRAAGGP